MRLNNRMINTCRNDRINSYNGSTSVYTNKALASSEGFLMV